MRKLIFVFIFAILSLPANSFELNSSPSSLYEKFNPAVVSVDTQLKDGISTGSGCIIDKSGVILTSAHILEDGKDIIVTIIAVLGLLRFIFVKM